MLHPAYASQKYSVVGLFWLLVGLFCDLLQAGPGTIAEAACCTLPMLVFDYLPGQEEVCVFLVCS